MISFTYSPSGVIRKGRYDLGLKVNDSDVSGAILRYNDDIVPAVLLQHLIVKDQYRNKGYGNLIMQEINRFIKETGSVGILLNTIFPGNPVSTIYRKNGWARLQFKEKYHLRYMTFQKELCSQKSLDELVEKAHNLTF